MQPDLARTFELIAAQGPKAFYEGAIADSLVADEKRGGGIITKEDLARYTPGLAHADHVDVSRLHAAHDAAVVVGRHHDDARR